MLGRALMFSKYCAIDLVTVFDLVWFIYIPVKLLFDFTQTRQARIDAPYHQTSRSFGSLGILHSTRSYGTHEQCFFWYTIRMMNRVGSSASYWFNVISTSATIAEPSTAMISSIDCCHWIKDLSPKGTIPRLENPASTPSPDPWNGFSNISLL